MTSGEVTFGEFMCNQQSPWQVLVGFLRRRDMQSEMAVSPPISNGTLRPSRVRCWRSTETGSWDRTSP
jgi:hypothetical protein